jgi:hypothetical protein
MSPLISVMENKLQLAALYLIPIANEACSKSPSSHLYYSVGVTLFSTGISEECPRLIAVACEKVNRVRDGGRGEV